MKADRSEPMNSTAVQSHRPDDASFADGTKAATGVQKMVICDAHTKATDNWTPIEAFLIGGTDCGVAIPQAFPALTSQHDIDLTEYLSAN